MLSVKNSHICFGDDNVLKVNLASSQGSVKGTYSYIRIIVKSEQKCCLFFRTRRGAAMDVKEESYNLLGMQDPSQ